jgi:hypothetical protein
MVQWNAGLYWFLPPPPPLSLCNYWRTRCIYPLHTLLTGIRLLEGNSHINLVEFHSGCKLYTLKHQYLGQNVSADKRSVPKNSVYTVNLMKLVITTECSVNDVV